MEAESSGPCWGEASRAVAIGGPLLCEGKKGSRGRCSPEPLPRGRGGARSPAGNLPEPPPLFCQGEGLARGSGSRGGCPTPSPPPDLHAPSLRTPARAVPAGRPVASDAETLGLCLGSAAPRRASRCCISGDSRLAAPLRSAPATPLLPPPPAGPGTPGSGRAGCGPPPRRDSVRSSPGAPTAPRARAGQGGEPGFCPFALFATKCGARGPAGGARGGAGRGRGSPASSRRARGGRGADLG